MPSTNQLPAKSLGPGIIGQYLHGTNMTMGMVQLEAGSHVPLHEHPQEQITFIVEGELEMRIGENKHLLRSGDMEVIPANTPHSATAISSCRLIDAFSPVREDYRNTSSVQWNKTS